MKGNKLNRAIAINADFVRFVGGIIVVTVSILIVYGMVWNFPSASALLGIVVGQSVQLLGVAMGLGDPFMPLPLFPRASPDAITKASVDMLLASRAYRSTLRKFVFCCLGLSLLLAVVTLKQWLFSPSDLERTFPGFKVSLDRGDPVIGFIGAAGLWGCALWYSYRVFQARYLKGKLIEMDSSTERQ